MANSFHVSLEGVKLTKEQSAAIEKGIQEVVMKTVARVDLSKGLVTKTNPFLDGIQTRGIYYFPKDSILQF